MRRVALGELAEINPRLSKGAIDLGHLVSFVPMAAVSELSKSIVETKAKPYVEVSKGYTYFDNGDLIVAKITPCYENGKMALAEGLAHSPAFGSTEFHVIRPGEKLLGRFLFHLLQSPAVRVSGKSRMKGAAGQKRVPPDFFKELKVPCPSLPEQKRIAAILDAADALRSKRRETLAQFDTLLQSTFLEMFGDPVTNPKGWGVASLKDLGALDRGVSKHRPRNAPELLGGPYPLIQTGDVSNSEGYIRTFHATYSEVGLKQSKLWPEGTLCITIAANIANTGILTFDACFPDSVVGFKSSAEGRVEFVQGLFWFLREIVEKRAPQVAQKNMALH